MNVHELAKILADTFDGGDDEGWTIETGMNATGRRKHKQEDRCYAYLRTAEGKTFSLTIQEIT